MCTVSFVPVKNGIVLTSNRDEWHTRGTAMIPKHESSKTGQVLIYPRDKDKGGSWIVAKNNGDAVVLLNGAFQPHIPEKNYRQSRGQVLLQIMNAEDPMQQWHKIGLDGIEPFTLVMYSQGLLNECRWDGMNKNNILLCSKTAHIWSSVTLYNEEMLERRNQWFNEWQNAFPTPDAGDIMQFHRTAGDGDPRCSLLMNRDEKIGTVSITSIHLSPKKIQMTHVDLKSDQQYISRLPLATAAILAIKPANPSMLWQ